MDIHQHKPVIKLNVPNDQHKFRPLPKPSGAYPYRMPAEKYISLNQTQMVFHMVGDTGSIRYPDFQRKVSNAMMKQYQAASDNNEEPQFLYHLGDIVYSYGEAPNYDEQFFGPYSQYPGPIFAIAGNHDSDVNPAAAHPYQSLDAFRAVFCDTEERQISFNHISSRQSITQPNIYWTLDTPLATIIGLYGNVVKFGCITPEQRDWFLAELKYAQSLRPDKAIIICVHHAPYSADINHGSSLYMIDFLNQAFADTGVRPDIVFSGHVHNYQRFKKEYPDGKPVTFVVAGAGGYDELHALANAGNELFTSADERFKHVTLENYCDDRHGFLKIRLSKEQNGLNLYGEYYTMQTNNELYDSTTLVDQFNIKIN
ncbi:metallophosphoesterase [Mucilaginibacter sp. CSA2-8R]|uniref:metallophosphoesterase family protein n=1 Tax=Mucilaginibacter sp. CSA2-8R TaxID=3141542 RepID=UPI00315D1D15